MEYDKEFLKQFRVNAETFSYVPVDNQIHEIPLIRTGTSKPYFAMVKAIESKLKEFQCSAIHCDLKDLDSCIGCRCLRGGREDGKSVVFEIEYIYQKS